MTRKKDILPSRLLAHTGFIFPRNEEELRRFEDLHSKPDEGIDESVVDPAKILKRNDLKHYSDDDRSVFFNFNPKEVVPERLVKKMGAKKINQSVGNKTWRHKSVVQLMNESSQDPVDAIRERARSKVLYALENGWVGPPFSAIELARILDIEITPNDTILDARTISTGKERFIIEYNPFQKPTRMNFSIAHEITHTFFSDCHEQIRNREESPQENRELEQLCNVGASELQLPYVIFPHDANGLKEITLENLIQLATKYKSSLESTFLSFIEVIDRACAVIICMFISEQDLVIDYYKPSSTFKPVVPKNFKIPAESAAYHCTTPGWSSKETVQWSFLDSKYDIYCIGLSPVRKDNRGRVGIIIVPTHGREDLQSRRINREFGDVTKPQGKGNKIIAQVVNTSGGLGAGVGKALAKNFPEVRVALEKWKSDKKRFKLGQTQLVQVKEDTWVLQMLAQRGLFSKNGEIPLQYTSLQQCLADLREHCKERDAQVFMPLIGAGQGKGNWEIIEGLIYTELVNHDVKVNIYLLNQPGRTPLLKSNLSLFNESSTWRKEK